MLVALDYLAQAGELYVRTQEAQLLLLGTANGLPLRRTETTEILTYVVPTYVMQQVLFTRWFWVFNKLLHYLDHAGIIQGKKVISLSFRSKYPRYYNYLMSLKDHRNAHTKPFILKKGLFKASFEFVGYQRDCHSSFNEWVKVVLAAYAQYTSRYYYYYHYYYVRYF